MAVQILSHTLEDYLEAIYQISSIHKVARSMDIADRLKVKRSSVTVALRSLAEKGYINYHARSFVTLTEKGLGTARCVDKRHHVLYDFFTSVLRLPADEADKAACSMEHGMSAEVCRRMIALLLAMEQDKESADKISKFLECSAAEIDCSKDCGYLPPSMAGEPGAGVELLNLNFLPPGSKGIIAEIRGSGALKKRLLEMGVIRDQAVAVVRAAPLDDPIEIKVRNAHLSLRREEASMILVKNVS